MKMTRMMLYGSDLAMKIRRHSTTIKGVLATQKGGNEWNVGNGR